MAKPKLGTGKRFGAFTGKLESEGYSKESAGAIAAAAGRKAHGAKQMAKFSAEGRKRAEHPMVKEARKAGLSLTTKKK